MIYMISKLENVRKHVLDE